MTLRQAAVQYLVYTYALSGYSLTYLNTMRAMRHLLLYTGDRPLAEIHEKHFLLYFSVVVRDQANVSMADTRIRSKVSQSFWRWMAKSHLVR
jgi:hypothetical protein